MSSLAAFSHVLGGYDKEITISLLLFCLAEEVLSRGISHLVDRGKLLQIASPKKITPPSHVLFIQGNTQSTCADEVS